MKAPGTAKITTFLPFHASVVNLEAGDVASIPFSPVISRNDRLTDTASKTVCELRGPGDSDERALGDGIADLNANHVDSESRGVVKWMWEGAWSSGRPMLSP